MTDPSSDFARQEAPAHHKPRSALASARSALLGVTATTLSLGFIEGCLHVEQRPIPLRFATTYALINMVPSAVWATVPARHVARACEIPPTTRLVPPPTAPAESMARSQVTRLMAIKSVRSLRHIAGSYGVLWTLWRYHGASNDLPSSQQSESPASPAEDRIECVVRLCRPASPLSRASRIKHGESIVQVPWEDVRQGAQVIDWNQVGIEQRSGGGALKVLEVELDSDHDGGAPFLIAKRAGAGADGATKRVAVVDAAATPEWRIGNGIDIYFFALSGIVKFICDHVTDESDQHVLLVTAVSEDEGESKLRRLVELAAKAITNYRGIAPTLGLDPSWTEQDDADEEMPGLVVVFGSTKEAAAAELANIKRTGFVPQDRILVIVEESLASVATALQGCAGVLSLADLSDDVLQDIRIQLRAGVPPDTIQKHIFEKFGEQSALLRRPDELSDLGRYI